jgi:hypothetical protein
MLGENIMSLTDEELQMELMEKNVGRSVTFQTDDGDRLYGKISGVSNTEHYTVLIDCSWPWPWYVRKEAIHFVEETSTKIK